MRKIEPLQFPDTISSELASAPPSFELVSPLDLRIDDRYQRGLSQRSIVLVLRMIKEWDWRAFKPPVVVATDGGWDVIDGQHTAIAAASHPGIDKIPVMVVQADAIAERADAFVRHNRDRVAVSSLELHFAMVAAGDETAMTIAQVCERAGVRLLKLPPSMGRFKVGDCMAVSAVRGLVNRRHAKGARIILQTAVEGRSAPISASLMRAIECLLYDPEYAGEITSDDIVSVLLAGHDLVRDAERFATEHRVPNWRGMASTIWMKKARRRRG